MSLSEEKICRYCFEDESVAKLVSPCDCKGSAAFIHKRCALKWMLVSESRVCELCNADFRCKPSRWATFKKSVRGSKHEAICYIVVFVIFMAPVILFKSIADALRYNGVLTYDEADRLLTGGLFGTYLLLIIFGVLFVAIWIHHCNDDAAADAAVAPEGEDADGAADDAAFGATDEGRAYVQVAMGEDNEGMGDSAEVDARLPAAVVTDEDVEAAMAVFGGGSASSDLPALPAVTLTPSTLVSATPTTLATTTGHATPCTSGLSSINSAANSPSIDLSQSDGASRSIAPIDFHHSHNRTSLNRSDADNKAGGSINAGSSSGDTTGSGSNNAGSGSNNAGSSHISVVISPSRGEDAAAASSGTTMVIRRRTTPPRLASAASATPAPSVTQTPSAAPTQIQRQTPTQTPTLFSPTLVEIHISAFGMF